MSTAFAMPELLGVVDWVVVRVVRNVGAEWQFYAMLSLALVIAVGADLIQRRNIVAKYTSRNVRTDMLYAVLELSHLEALLLLAPVAAALNAAIDASAPWLRLGAFAALPFWIKLIVLFVAADFLGYWFHRLKHASPWFWQFHKVHHSQSQLTVFTRFRFPMLDRLLDMLLLFPLGVIAGSTVLPIALYLLVAFRSCIEHSGIDWSFGPLGRLIVSPNFHATHHSTAPEHVDRNFANSLAIWDHMFGTFVEKGDKPLSYGLAHETIPETFVAGQWAPVAGLWTLARQKLFPASVREPAA